MEFSDRSRIGRASNRKGKGFELVIANLLSSIFKVSFRRVPRSGGLREFNSWDIMRFRGKQSLNPSKKTLLDRVGIECKNEAAKFPVFLENWLTQCEESARDDGNSDWVLFFHRPNTNKDYAILPTSFIEKIFRELQGFRDESKSDDTNGK